MCCDKTSGSGCCRTSLSLVRLCDCLRFTDDPQASVSFELSRNWSRAVLWLYLIDFLQLCNFKLSSERISPKGFLASKCNVGNWIFSKLGSFWEIFLGRFFGRIFGRNSLFILVLTYRVPHGKVNKVIWLCWGYSFWFLMIFWVLCVHEKGTFMLNSSVFIFLMLRALYGSITQNLLFLNKFWIILTFRGLFQVIESNKPSKIYIFL